MPDSVTPSKAIVVQTLEEERFRLARVLQNGPAQVFANAAVEIETSLGLLEEQPQAARAGLIALAAELREGLARLRELIGELHPPLLGEFGLPVCLERYVDDFARNTGISTRLDGWNALAERLPSTMEMAIFRIIQEALENVRTHSRATLARVSLTSTPERLVVCVEDNGRGFVADTGTFGPGRRLGLLAMSDRAELLGGQLQVFSEPGHGVRVVLTVPLNRHSV